MTEGTIYNNLVYTAVDGNIAACAPFRRTGRLHDGIPVVRLVGLIINEGDAAVLPPEADDRDCEECWVETTNE